MENLSLKENKPTQSEIKYLPHVSYVENEKAVYCFKQPNFNSHDYVDLALPSGTIWATKNVGATTIMESGNFYLWGSTTSNNDTYCDWNNAIFNDGSKNFNAEYMKISVRNACPNSKLDKKYDVAREVMGGSWHMPTKEQCEELLNETTREFKTINGINAVVLTSKHNGNTITFPIHGVRYEDKFGFKTYSYIWSSSLFEGGVAPISAWYIIFSESNVLLSYGFQNYGLNVRGVV